LHHDRGLSSGPCKRYFLGIFRIKLSLCIFCVRPTCRTSCALLDMIIVMVNYGWRLQIKNLVTWFSLSCSFTSVLRSRCTGTLSSNTLNFTSVSKGTFFWDVTPCNLVDTNILSSQPTILVYQTVARHIPEESSRDSRCRDNMKCHSSCSFPRSFRVAISITYSSLGCVFNLTRLQLSSGHPSGLRTLLCNGLLKYEMASYLGTRWWCSCSVVYVPLFPFIK